MDEDSTDVPRVLEVTLTDENEQEHIYWVKTEGAPTDADLEDWAIEISRKHHSDIGGTPIPEDEFDEDGDDEILGFAFVCEPFERQPDEYTWVN